MPQSATALATCRSEAIGNVEAVDMVRQIAHELRQPLSTIESIAFYLDLVLPADQSRVRAQVDRLKKMVEQSNWIVSNAVHFVQDSAAVPQLLDLRELLNTAASECAYGNSVECDLRDPAPLIRLDPAQAMHLFYSLFVFFRNIASPSHPLRIAGQQSDGTTVVCLSTTAPGYSPTAIQTILEPFSPCLPPGSGLSMASVRRIVEVHHGSLDVTADDKLGVTITLEIPICPPAAYGS